MKKFMSILLAAALTVSLGVTAMAVGETDGTAPGYHFTKTFTLTDHDLTSPAATFHFKVESATYKSFSTGTTESPVTLDATNTPTFGTAQYVSNELDSTNNYSLSKDVSILTFPTYDKVGVYKYKIIEDIECDDYNPSVAYDSSSLYMYVTVGNDFDSTTGAHTGYSVKAVVFSKKADGTDKTEDGGFTNTYPATTLSIKKEVTGAYGDVDDTFTVTVTLDKSNVTTPIGDITFSNSDGSISTGDWTGNTATATLTIKHGETITLSGLVEGIKVTVAESVSNGYNATYAVTGANNWTVTPSVPANSETDTEATDGSAEGTMPSTPVTVTITNTREEAPPTGISLDSLPYLVLLGGVAVGLAIVFLTKRRSCED